MFELTLCLAFERQKYLTEFYKSISSFVKNDSGIIIKHNTNGKSYLLVAVDESKKEYLKSKVLDFVCKVIEIEFKYKFFKDKIMIDSTSELNEAFFRAIAFFDEEIDKETIANNIEFSGEIVIESLFYFKLQSLISRWENTAKIINQNFIMQSSASICEVLKYLCAVSENNSVFVDVRLSKKQIELKNFSFNKKFKFDDDGISKLFAEIIKLNPIKINIIEKEKTEQFEKIKNILVGVFNEKIYFV